jgi:hypothetical protein
LWRTGDGRMQRRTWLAFRRVARGKSGVRKPKEGTAELALRGRRERDWCLLPGGSCRRLDGGTAAAHAAHSFDAATERTGGVVFWRAAGCFRHLVLLFVPACLSAVRVARRGLWKHLSTAVGGLASTAQRKRNGRKRRYLWGHEEDKPGNGAPRSAMRVNMTGVGRIRAWTRVPR